jgi:hypothetical protein
LAIDNLQTNNNELEYPQVRMIEAIPIQQDGQELICLRDPQQIATNILMVPPQAFYIISLFDGSHSILDMQENFLKQFGQLIQKDQIEAIIQQLDQELYLETENYRFAVKRLKTNFIILDIGKQHMQEVHMKENPLN